MKLETFEGLVGPVGFNGSDPISAQYSFVQATPSNFSSVVGHYNNGNMFINFSALHFGPSGIPVSRIIPLYVSLDSVGGTVVTVLAVVVLLISVVLTILIWVFRRNKPIKASSPLFCELILLGISLCSISMIISSLYPSRWVCDAGIWMLNIGFGLILSNLLAKTYRIYKIFTNRRFRVFALQDKDLLVLSGGILFLFAILLLMFTIFNGSRQPTVTVSEGSPYIHFLVCDYSNPLTYRIILYLLISVHGLLVCLLAVLAFLTRNVDSEYNESVHIAVAVYSYVLIFLIVIPLYLISEKFTYSPVARYYESNISTILMMAVTLGAIFGPKLANLWNEYKSAYERSYFDSLVLTRDAISTARISGVYSLRSNFEGNLPSAAYCGTGVVENLNFVEISDYLSSNDEESENDEINSPSQLFLTRRFWD